MKYTLSLINRAYILLIGTDPKAITTASRKFLFDPSIWAEHAEPIDFKSQWEICRQEGAHVKADHMLSVWGCGMPMIEVAKHYLHIDELVDHPKFLAWGNDALLEATLRNKNLGHMQKEAIKLTLKLRGKCVGSTPASEELLDLLREEKRRLEDELIRERMRKSSPAPIPNPIPPGIAPVPRIPRKEDYEKILPDYWENPILITFRDLQSFFSYET